jgi:hypothetical protein
VILEGGHAGRLPALPLSARVVRRASGKYLRISGSR